MAKQKQKKTSPKEKKTRPQPTSLQMQIWGAIYMSLAVLMTFSLLSHYLGDGINNLLGPWVGTYLALGLEGLFGSVAIFLLPAMVLHVGYRIFRGEQFDVKTLIITSAIMLEAAVLVAIPTLPFIAHTIPEGMGNIIGITIIKFLFEPIFGTTTFGPYFIVIVALILTIVGFLEIDMHKFFSAIKKWWNEYSSKIKEDAEKRSKERRLRAEKKAAAKAERKTLKQEAIKERRSKELDSGITIEDLAKQMSDDEPTPVIITGNDNEPITPDEPKFTPPEIITHDEESESESIDEEEPIVDSEGDIGDAAFIDPNIAKNDSDSEEHISAVSDELLEELPKQKPYQLPSPDLLEEPPARNNDVDKLWIQEKSIELIRTLEEFRLKGCEVVAAHSGPVVTQFEIKLAPGIQVKKIVNLQDDIALKVGGKAIRIQAPIPGKAAVGIEIPNDNREIVYYKDILTSSTAKNSNAKLPVIVGKSISGKPLIEDITKMPHILIAGQTGAGKSVGINSFIATLLFNKTPEELRLIMIDPKKVEMACYEGIPHLMSPVVTEPEKAVAALQWGVKEMEYRYRLLAKVGAKNLDSFNAKVESGALQKFLDRGDIEEEETRKLPYVVIIIDELADLMMTASKDVEALVQRIAQLARAVGIHLIVATQRPSVDIITGPIKANLTSRISFRTIQSQDSRTILGAVGSEKLLGMGDMLYLKNGAPTINRYHGAFISEEDVERLVDRIREQNYETGKIQFKIEEKGDSGNANGEIPSGGGDKDELFEEVARLVMSNGIASTSMVQRRFKIGYNRAGRIMDQLEDSGVVGPAQGGKPREILITKEVLEEILDLME